MDNGFLTSLLTLNDTKLTHSQRSRCMALFALQDNPFGMLSQSLYSRALERQNSHKRTIADQKNEIEEINSLKELLLEEYRKMNDVMQQKQKETLHLEQLLLDQFDELNDELIVEDVGNDLVDQLNQSEKLNRLLLQVLNQAMLEIQRFITMSN